MQIGFNRKSKIATVKLFSGRKSALLFSWSHIYFKALFIPKFL